MSNLKLTLMAICLGIAFGIISCALVFESTSIPKDFLSFIAIASVMWTFIFFLLMIDGIRRDERRNYGKR